MIIILSFDSIYKLQYWHNSISKFKNKPYYSNNDINITNIYINIPFTTNKGKNVYLIQELIEFEKNIIKNPSSYSDFYKLTYKTKPTIINIQYILNNKIKYSIHD